MKKQRESAIFVDMRIPSYQSKLDVRDTQFAIKYLKDVFQKSLARKLRLTRVSAPLFVEESSGLNDGLSGKERPISFHVEEIDETLEIVHSLAKWKRHALALYHFLPGEGLYTDMNAIRKDEVPDFMHSFYVDQWDWEKIISPSQRTLAYLKKTVRDIYSCIYRTSVNLEKRYPCLKNQLPKEIAFVSTKELEERYPSLTRKERENAICKEMGAVFLYGIGGKLSDGAPHDQRAADYDDWTLNGDILVYDPLYDIAFELSSMGIRVDAESLRNQLKEKGEEAKLSNPYCQALLEGKLPLTIGGGIGQSRLAMFLLQKAHIGEVQVSCWSKSEREERSKQGIQLL